MRTEEGVLEEYRKGDLYKRLNLYLQHRDLRSEFTEIDLSNRASSQAEVSERNAAKTMISTGHALPD